MKKGSLTTKQRELIDCAAATNIPEFTPSAFALAIMNLVVANDLVRMFLSKYVLISENLSKNFSPYGLLILQNFVTSYCFCAIHSLTEISFIAPLIAV